MKSITKFNKFNKFVIEQLTVIEPFSQRPYSPDLGSSDIYLFSELRKTLAGNE